MLKIDFAFKGGCQILMNDDRGGELLLGGVQKSNISEKQYAKKQQ